VDNLSEEYILVFDIGTGSTKATLITVDGKIVASTTEEYGLSHPYPGWAEQDPEDWWKAVVATTRNILKKSEISPKNVIGISFDAQMINVIPVDKEGKPLRPSIIWMDARAGEEAKELEEKISIILMVSAGLLPMISAKDVPPRILWLKRHEPHVFEKTYKFLDCKDYLIYKLTGKYVTDWTCALLTGMLHVREKEWCEEFLEYLGINVDQLPEPLKTIDIVGTLTDEAAKVLGLPKETPVICGAGDLPATALGSGAIGDGEAHVYIGTSSWIGVHLRPEMYTLDPDTGMGTIFSGDPEKLLLTGEMENSGNCYRWFRDELGYKEVEEAKKAGKDPYYILDNEASKIPPGSDKLIFLPWMLGERAPLQDHTVRGGFVNLSLRHTRAHMVRAVLEGVAYHLRWIVDCIERLGFKIEWLNACGGGAQSPIWMQILADVTGKEIRRVHAPLDAPSLGTAMMVGVGLKVYKDFETAAKKLIKIEKVFTPDEKNRKVYEKLYGCFKEIYARLEDVFYELNEKEGEI